MSPPLSFAVPPKSVVVGSPPARRVGEGVKVACTAEDSNPKTALVWLKRGKPVLQAGERQRETMCRR